MTREEAATRKAAITELAMKNENILGQAIVYLADTLAPAVEAFVEATKIGGAFGPRPGTR